MSESNKGLRLYNTLTRSLQPFEPLDGRRVGLYTCGPTVYDAPHIGNLRTFVFEDVLRRALLYLGYEVTQVMNLTDVEDKIIDGAHRAGATIEDFTAPHVDAFFGDLDALGVERADHYPRATAYIDDMIAMVATLIEKGFAYQADGGVFFRIENFPEYGRLSNIDLEHCRRGERVADDEYGKDDVRDFVLWKSAKEHEPSWPSPWGPGRPGWHIECSAMSRSLLGETFDIHCGGVDNIFPHHENEIAQSQCAHGAPFVRYWLHSEHLMVDGEKMSKSKGNMYRLDDLRERGISARALRYLFVSVHYRRKINFTGDSVTAANAALRRLDEFRLRFERALAKTAGESRAETIRPALSAAATRMQDEFRAALQDDLNVSEALASIFRLVKEGNRTLDDSPPTEEESSLILKSLDDVDRVLGVLDPAPWREREQIADDAEGGLANDEIERLVADREQARKEKRWADADALRDRLTAAGVVLEDSADGTLWRRQ